MLSQFPYLHASIFKAGLTVIKKIILMAPLLLLFLSCGKEREKLGPGIILKDDLGVEQSFEKIPERIITLAPNLTEMVFELGLGKKLIGNTSYCDYPEEAKKVEKVGDLLTVNFEKIVSLKPDLVFITVEGNTKETYDKFHQLGIKIFVSNPRGYDGIKKSFRDIAKIFGIENSASKKIAEWDSVISRIKSENSPFRKKKAMFIVDLKPLMLAGKNTFLNEYLQICGLENIALSSRMNYPIFSREEILKLDPDYIIYPSGSGLEMNEINNAYPEWIRLKALKNGCVVFVDWSLYSRPGPRFVRATEDLFNRLLRTVPVPRQ